MEESSPVGNVAFDGVFYAAWSPLISLAWAALFVTLATLVSAYPAWKASRTDPVTSMRKS
jgi:ABC-type lipoprotein release transport system permease subunit